MLGLARKPHPVDGIPMLAWATLLVDNLHVAEHGPFPAKRDWVERQHRGRTIAYLRGKLVAAAEAAFTGRDQAHLFLHGDHDRTMRERPYDFCTLKQRLDLILGLLPRPR